MEYMIFLGFVYLIYRWKIAKKDRVSRSQSITQPVQLDFNRVIVSISSGRPEMMGHIFQTEQEMAQQISTQVERYWCPPGSPVQVGNYTIPMGMVYVGQHPHSPFTMHQTPSVEPALIQPQLAVHNTQPDRAGLHLTYWPSYATLSPESRAAYLEWLADGASAPETNIGYVFLYYYGLEYRLLAAGEKPTAERGERHLLVQEVNRLLAIYGGNSSFRHYATSLLTFLMVQDGMEPPMPTPGRFVADGEIFGTFVQLGRVVASGQPISSSLALAWLCVDPDTYFRTPASRCWKEFSDLFDIHFQQLFPKGLFLKPNKTRLAVVYRPASSGFGGREQKITTDLPDLRVIRKPLENLRLLAGKCEGELEPYSRFLGRNPGMAGSLPAMAWLPDALLPACAGAESLRRFVEPLLAALQQQERVVIPSAELLQHWPVQKTGQVSKREMVTIVQLLDKFLVGLEPDVRFTPLPMQWDGRVCFFRLQEPGVITASTLFQDVAVLLHLSVIMAGAGKPVSEAKRRHLLSFLNGISGLVVHERARLLAHLEWLLIAQPGLTGLKKRLTGKSIADARGWAQFLISLASVDGSVDAGDVAVLTKIYPLLGLQSSEFHADLHTHQLSRHDQEMAVVSLGDGPPSPEYPLPRPPSVETTGLVRLDGRRVAETMANTAEVHKMLSDIFAGDPDPEESSATVVPSPPIGLEGVAGLDGEYLRLFHRMTEQIVWERKAFDALCRELGLFPDGALEILNEAAYALCGSPLLDGDDPMEVDMEIVKEMRVCPTLTK
ncbi:MAG: TerB N-terminal domain-containing protein [Magnetococcus sp. YQC-5]